MHAYAFKVYAVRIYKIQKICIICHRSPTESDWFSRQCVFGLVCQLLLSGYFAATAGTGSGFRRGGERRAIPRISSEIFPPSNICRPAIRVVSKWMIGRRYFIAALSNCARVYPTHGGTTKRRTGRWSEVVRAKKLLIRRNRASHSQDTIARPPRS